MQPSYWYKQILKQPLFPDLLWSRPENRQTAGKLLIIGGNLHGFAAPAEAYSEALKAGVGVARVLLPDSLKNTVGRTFEAGEFAPSTPSGSFSQKALSELLELSYWADGALIAGDLGRNSETAILLEKFIEKYHGQLTITKDAADYFIQTPQPLLERPDTTLVISLAQLQKLGTHAKFTKPFTFDMDLIRLVETLHDFTEQHSLSIIVKHLKNIVVASEGKVSSTSLAEDQELWRIKASAHAAVWSLQNPSQTFKSITTAIYTTVV